MALSVFIIYSPLAISRKSEKWANFGQNFVSQDVCTRKQYINLFWQMKLVKIQQSIQKRFILQFW